MENFEPAQPVENMIPINSEMKDYILETAKWGKLLAIIGYVGMGLLVLLGIGVMVGFSIFNSLSETSFPMGALGIVYILLGAAYYFPVNYLYQFSVQIKQGLKSSNEQTATTGFRNLKSLFKFMGIFTIVIMSLYGLIIIVAVPVAIFAGR